MKISLDFSLQKTRRVFALAIAPLLFVLAGCASHEAGIRQEASGSTQQAATLLAEARHTQNTNTRLGLTLTAADKASQGIAGGDAPDARTLYNTACAELAVLLKKSSSAPTLPVTLTTPAGPYVLEFDNARNPGRWEPTYFTELLTPAELRSKSLVSRQPTAGYGGVLVGVYRPLNPREMLLPRIGVSAPVTAVLNFSKPSGPGQPARAILTLYDSPRQTTAELRAKTARWPPICAPRSGFTRLPPSWAS
jgi:hypothetical protein